MAGGARKARTIDPESERERRRCGSLIREIEARMGGAGPEAVLVVEDEPGVRKYVVRSIHRAAEEVEVFEAGNGLEALEKLQEIRRKLKRDPVLIVTDLRMPVMDGWEMIERLRREYVAAGKEQGIPIIAYSATTGEKGVLFKKSVHPDKARYEPIIDVAKEMCVAPEKYSVKGEKGLLAWIRQFLKHTS